MGMAVDLAQQTASSTRGTRRASTGRSTTSTWRTSTSSSGGFGTTSLACHRRLNREITCKWYGTLLRVFLCHRIKEHQYFSSSFEQIWSGSYITSNDLDWPLGPFTFCLHKNLRNGVLLVEKRWVVEISFWSPGMAPATIPNTWYIWRQGKFNSK